MDLLLDSHVFLWWEGNNRRLAKASREAIADSRNKIWISVATIWEIEIKRALGKLPVTGDVVASVAEAGFSALPISAGHAVLAARLPRHHQDPFDRMIVAQAITENLVLVTSDARLRAYDVAIFASGLP